MIFSGQVLALAVASPKVWFQPETGSDITIITICPFPFFLERIGSNLLLSVSR